MGLPDTVDFAPGLLRILHVLVPPGTREADLALEMGLSAPMRASDTDADEALRQMWIIRHAVLECSGMDVADEPIPLVGRVARLAVLHFAIYLGSLVERAAAHRGCRRDDLVEAVLDHLAAHQVRSAFSGIRVLRSS